MAKKIAKRKPPPPGKGGSSNIRAYFTTRKGEKIWAKDYGYEGWPIGGRT